MKIKHLFGIIIAATALTACSDDMAHRGDNSPSRQQGFQYFNVKEKGVWEDDNASTRSGIEAPIAFNTDLKNATPLYMHTEVEPTAPAVLTEEVAETRGNRITGDVFDSTNPRGHWDDFAVYGKNNNGNNIFAPFQQFHIGGIEENNRLTSNEDWYVKGYSDSDWETLWNGGTTGTFYAYAPYFAYGAADINSNGLKSYLDEGAPKIDYYAPETVSNQLDLLTAYNSSANKGKSIDLEFEHVLSSVKFKIKGTDGKNHFWEYNKVKYEVTVNSIRINNVWPKGTLDIATKTWTIDNSVEKRSFELDCKDESWSIATSSGTLLQPNGASSSDRETASDENVFMMLPQTLPAGATVQLVVTLTAAGHPDIPTTITAKINGKTWLPGHTYYYTISLDAFDYIFDYNTATAKSYNNVPAKANDGDYGTYEEGIFIRSYKVGTDGNKINVDWKPQYYETDASVTGVGNGSADSGSWKDGSNGWIHIYDRSTGSYATEVTSTHGGAHEGESDNIRLFKIEISSIMKPIIDLSLWNQDQTKRWRGRSTSNCYIVAGPGTYRIPLIYGNAWTNGNKNESAYKTDLPASQQGDFMLKTFLNCNDVAIQSPFINIDLADKVDHACLIWEEGDGTSRTNTGGTSSGARGDKYGDNYNVGTVVKVIKAIDTSITGEDDYNTDNGDYKKKANYLQFEIDPDNFNYGNAVVGIRDDANKILWSWHIWITDPQTFLGGQQLSIDSHDYTLAGTNIGWVQGGQSIPAQTREGQARLVQAESGKIITINATQQKRRAFTTYFTNVLYQWGRKDPMRGNVNTDDMGTDHGAPRGTAGVVPWYNNFGSTATVGTLIKNPNSIYAISSGDLYPSSALPSSNKSYCNLWATNLKKTYQSMYGTWQFNGKTIYDPSPVGYCVPPARYLMMLTQKGIGTDYEDGFEDIASGVTLPILCHYTWGGKTVNFYACGVRTTTSGGDCTASGYYDPPNSIVAMGTGASKGFYHTATPYSRDETYQLHLYFYDDTNDDTHNKILGDNGEALCVLPILYNGEAVTTQD